MTRTRRILKRLGIGIAAFFGLLLIAAIAIPFFINVDTYRPQIVQTVNDKINGKFELGKLTLTLWGQIKIQVDGFSLVDSQNRKVVSAKDVYFHVPWGSILSGAPLLTFKMTKPEVAVVKDKTGKMNVMTLMKPSTAPEVKKDPSAGGGTSLPGMATRARLGIEMRDALLSYQDAVTGLSTQVKDLNVIVKDLSLSRATEMEVWANLDTTMGTLVVRGPARLTAKANPEFKDGVFQQATASLKADLNDIEVLMPPMFAKKKGIAANATSQLKISSQEARIETAEVKFHNAVVTASGGATNLGAEPASAQPSPVVQLTFKSNEIELKPWSELVPMLAEYNLSGTAALDGGADGPTDKLQYRANIAVKSMSAKAPHLKAEPKIDALIKIVTDQIENLTLTMKAPGNDLKVSGKLVSFTAPKADFQVTSTGMDLDQLIDFPKPEKKGAGEGGGGAAKGAPKGKESDLDEAVAPLRANKMAAATRANIVFNLAMLKAYGVKISDMNGQMSFRDLGFYIDRFRMGLWAGTVSATAGILLKPKVPTYRFTADVASLDIKQAVTSQFELLKNTLLGIANFKMEATGASFNPEPAKSNLNAKGTMKVVNATFATIDVGRMATEAINRSIENISAKIPALKGQNVKAPASTESKYDLVTSDFSINGGMFSAPNFFAKAEANRGIDVKGITQVGIKDYSLKANWELVDTYNLTKARDVAVIQSGVRIERVLAEGDKPVSFPVIIGGTVQNPVPNYASVPEALTRVALANASRAVEGKAKAEAKKVAEEQSKKLIEKAPPKTQEALKGLGKKLFGN